MQTKRESKTQMNRTGLRHRRVPVSVSALFLILITAFIALFAVACGDDPSPTPTPTATATPEPMPEPTATPTPEPTPMDDDALTLAFVTTAIEYYGENGRDATIAHYKTEAGTENGRTLILLDEAESTLLVYRNIPALEGQYVGPGSAFAGLTQLVEAATEEGFWITTQGVNPVTKQEEPRRVFIILHDGLVFSSSHSALVEDVADSVKE